MDPGTRKLKDVLRAVHMVGAVLVILYVYLPLGDNPAFEMLIKVGAIPLLLVTGAAMKHAAALRKRLSSS